MEKTFQNILVQFQLILDLPGRESLVRQDASRNGLGLESPATCGGIRLRARLWRTGCRFHGLPRDGGSYSWKDGLMCPGAGVSLQHFVFSGERDGLRIRWLEWLSESTNERSSAMGRWYLGQLENGSMPEEVAFLVLEIQDHAGGAASRLVVFQQPEMELYQRLVEAARNRLADLEMEFGIGKSKVDAMRSRCVFAPYV